MRARHRHLNIAAAGYSLVLDARFISALSSGSTVASWPDRSANGNNATEATNKPTLQASVQGGNPVVRFAGNKLMCATSAFSGSGHKQIVAVYKSTSTGTYTDTVAGQTVGITPTTWFALQSRTQFVTGDPYIAGYSADTQSGMTTPDNAFKIATGAHDGSTLYTRKNGTQVDSVARTMATANVAFSVGHSGNGVVDPEYLDGDIAFVAAGPVTYSLPLLQRIERSLALIFKIACS